MSQDICLDPVGLKEAENVCAVYSNRKKMKDTNKKQEFWWKVEQYLSLSCSETLCMQRMRNAIEFQNTFDIVSLSIAPILFVIVCLMRFA